MEHPAGDLVDGLGPTVSGENVRPHIEAHADRLKASGAIRSGAVERAFRRVPRHLFVESFFVARQQPTFTLLPIEYDPARPERDQLELIYSGAALVVRAEAGMPTSSSSESGLVAQMLELLEVRPGARVLEIGTGSGYNAALLAELTGDQALVTTVDIQPDVVEQARRSFSRAGYDGIRTFCRDGFFGAPEAAPFDRIVATVGCPDLSPHWVEQLAPSGFVLLPLRHLGANPLLRVWREGDAVVGRLVGFSGFMAAQGALHDPAYWGDRAAPPSGEQVERRSAWPELRESAARRIGFWFYVGARDRRARMFRWTTGFGLYDPDTGCAAGIDGDSLVSWSPNGPDRQDEARGLRDDFEALYGEWRRLGAPRLTDYRVAFVSLEAREQGSRRGAVAPGAGEEALCALDGKYYRRVCSLSRASP